MSFRRNIRRVVFAWLAATTMAVIVAGCAREVAVVAEAPSAHQIQHLEYWNSWGMDGAVAYITPTPLWYDAEGQTVYLTVWPDGSNLENRSVLEPVGFTSDGTESTSDSGDDVDTWGERAIVPRSFAFHLEPKHIDELVAKFDSAGVLRNGEAPDPAKLPTDIGIGDGLRLRVDGVEAIQYTWTAQKSKAGFLAAVVTREFWEELTNRKGKQTQARLWMRISGQTDHGPGAEDATTEPFPIADLKIDLPLDSQTEEACAWVSNELAPKVQELFAEPRTPVWVAGSNPDGSLLRRAVYFTPIYPGQPEPECY